MYIGWHSQLVVKLSERKIMKHTGTSSEIYKEKIVAGSSMKATSNYHL